MKRSVTLLLCSVLSYQSFSAIGAERPKRPPPAVTAYEVETRELPQTYVSSGTLAAYQQAELHTDMSGRIAELYVRSGDYVEAGAPLVKLDTRSAQAELERLQSQLNLAQQQLERQRSLVKKMAGAAEQVDIQEAQVAGLQSNIRIARLALERHQLTAPFSGVLGSFDWVEGGWITSNEAFSTLDNVTQLKVNFDLPERYLRFIELGREVELLSAAWPEERFIGQVSLIDARMNAQRATLSVQALIDNQQGLLRPGMRVSVSLRVDSGEAKLVVPARTLIHEGQRTSVLRLDDESTAKTTAVSVGQETSEWVEITSGLAVGDRIVDRGLVKAKPNRPVRVLGEGGNERGQERQRREQPQS
ncbi:MAG TPA: efflux RND transporter periplasmic adaptor subunit [Marinobacterium sp.]|nr:efflux RND transporter periplasmic adaptor subunit [Marinobacterium sp.]